jgi:hypothetical protein
VLVVPLAGTPMSVTIVYDVETVDNGLGLLSDGVPTASASRTA